MNSLKSFIILTIMICGGAMSAVALTPVAPIPVAVPSPAANDWIEVGQVNMYRYAREYRDRQYRDTKYYFKATLFAYYVGDRMLYKLEYKGTIYGVTKNENYGDKNASYTQFPEYNAKVTIDGKNYYLHVPNW